MQLSQELLKFQKPHAHTSGQLRLGRGTVELRCETTIRSFDNARLLAQTARAPIHGTKAIQDGAANPELCKSLQLHLLCRIESLESLHQADDSGVHEILKRNLD